MRVMIMISYVVLVSCVFAQENKQLAPKNNEVIVYYYGFKVDRITGLHESEIQKYGCLYFADRNIITSSLTISENAGEKYNRSNIRASMIIDDSIYYIDYNGIARKDDVFFVIDKDKFVQSLKFISCTKE